MGQRTGFPVARERAAVHRVAASRGAAVRCPRILAPSAAVHTAPIPPLVMTATQERLTATLAGEHFLTEIRTTAREAVDSDADTRLHYFTSTLSH